jgi:hypothetical protein
MRIRETVEPLLRAWAVQRRRVLLGGYWRRISLGLYDPPAWHCDGHPELSVAALVRDGGRSGKIEQHFAEVYTGDALTVWRALNGAPEQSREVLDVHYVVTMGSLRTRWEFLGLDRKGYFTRLRIAEHYLAGRLHAMEGHDMPACLLVDGASQRARAKALGLALTSYHRWQKKHPDTLDAYLAGWRGGPFHVKQASRDEKAEHPKKLQKTAV